MAKIFLNDCSLDLKFPPLESMTDDEFFDFCQQNKDLNIERDENHQILFMAPVFSEYAFKNASLNGELYIWNKQHNLGRLGESSAGFYLPDTSMRSPDASWISWERWNALPEKKKTGFACITPDFVAELASPCDSIEQLKTKMEKWRSNGAKLGWLIDPKNELVFIYRIDGTVSKVSGFDDTLSGEDVLPGFEFDLRILKNE
jgi:Uma2 family endonuclease